ncbi:MAG: hypothetical protein R3B13_31050 [Polyangiaceae bacterium]
MLRWTWILAAVLGVSACLDRPAVPVDPATTNLRVDQIRQARVDKMDLLFVIDNSASMADKQAMLEAAVPKLVQRLVTPRCVDSATGTVVAGSVPDCPAGTTAEFQPVRDIHVGVISSSLGAHGGQACGQPGHDDKGRLLSTVRAGLPNHEGLDFLRWNPGSDATDDAGPDTLIDEFGAQVVSAGEGGCGYEASLEAWYRFLVDPQPPDTVTKEGNFTSVLGCSGEGADCGSAGVCVGGFCADKVVLAQRQAFLRGDSLVGIVMLSDENDCSIRDDGSSWLVGAGAAIPRASSACSSNPDDPCCYSCGLVATPEGCPPKEQDSECMQTKGIHPKTDDHVNLRCWEQKRRFGVDMLYPTSRYVEGLTQPRIADRAGREIPNPLFATGGGSSRDPSLIYAAGIVGVPWQAIATDDSQQAGAPLEYKNARDIDWARITRQGRTPALDPHMIESLAPRPGLADSSVPLQDPAHGHDWNITAGFGAEGPGDLQFACIFPLAETRPCAGKIPCDCSSVGVNGKSPLCWDGAQYTDVQRYAKAYPGLRQLEVLRDFGDNAIVASICPKQALDAQDPSFGYNPAMNAIVDRLKEHFSGTCITRPVEVTTNPDGTTTTQCAVVEVTRRGDGQCACDDAANRREPNAKLVGPVLQELRTDRVCGPGSADQVACTRDEFCLCELGEATSKASCENDVAASGIGWCYVDPSQGVGRDEVIPSECNPRRQLRFVGPDTPAAQAVVFIACVGKPLDS